MNFLLTEEHLAVQIAARDFARTELLPGVIDRDRHEKFPAEQIRKMGELGFMGMMVDPAYNGGGMDTISYVLAMEEISKIDASASVCMSVNNSLVCWGMEKFGTTEQKEKYLTKLASGEKIGAFCRRCGGSGHAGSLRMVSARPSPRACCGNIGRSDRRSRGSGPGCFLPVIGAGRSHGARIKPRNVPIPVHGS